MEFDHIIKLPPKELYDKALEFKKSEDYDNYYMYMLMSANYDYKLAETDLLDAYDKELYKKQNYSNTKSFYEATQNYSCSMSSLAYMYDDGLGVTQDYNKAKEFYIMAIEKGNSEAMNNLALMYDTGRGVDQDYNKAKELYEMSINKGNSTAMYNLAIMYENGEDIIQDYNKAKELYEMGVMKGESDCMNNLGILYQYGRGVIRNFNKAKELYEMAIIKENPEGITYLVILYQSTDLKNNKQDVINYFLKINKSDKLMEIYGYDDYDIKLIVEHCKQQSEISRLKRKIDELETHIMASPEGELYFEAKNNWNACLTI